MLHIILWLKYTFSSLELRDFSPLLVGLNRVKNKMS